MKKYEKRGVIISIITSGPTSTLTHSLLQRAKASLQAVILIWYILRPTAPPGHQTAIWLSMKHLRTSAQ